MKKYFPKSIIFITFLVMLNLLILGLIALLIFGVIVTNWAYIIIGIFGTIILSLEDIKLLSCRIVLLEDSMLVYSSVFECYLKNTNTIQIKYKEIDEIKLINNPLKTICLVCKGYASPVIIYVKQFSKKQVSNLICDINKKITNNK